MAEIRVNPTRMELKKVQARYLTARRGHKLLKDKRDELMKQFLDVVREDKALREKIEESLDKVYKSFSVAAAVSSPKMLEEALLIPKTESSIGISYKNMMSVIVPQFSLGKNGNGNENESENGNESETESTSESTKSAGAGSVNYGMAFTSGELDGSIGELDSVLPDLIRLAELEKAAELLAEEIEKTRRRVNALEYIMMPQYLETIKTIKMKLDENERGNTTRLMKVKDMMLAAQLEQKIDEDEENEENPED